MAATFTAYFEYVAGEGQAFRLVFESDLSNEAAVRERLERGQQECAQMISQMVEQDAGLDDDEARLLSVAMVGLAQVTARYWLTTRDHIPRETAEQLVARLAWRGISGWPRSSTDGGTIASAQGAPVEVKIGIQSVPRELVVETDAPAAEIERTCPPPWRRANARCSRSR